MAQRLLLRSLFPRYAGGIPPRSLLDKSSCASTCTKAIKDEELTGIFVGDTEAEVVEVVEDVVVIGVDLGSTNARVCVMEEENAKVRWIPSVVSFNEMGTVIVGEAAKLEPKMLSGGKRLFGSRFGEDHIRREMATSTFKIVEDRNGLAMFEWNDQQYSPSIVGSFLLIEMKKMAESDLKKKVKKVVLPVPAYFDKAHRKATVSAGKLAGLDVVAIIEEPIAAAMAYEGLKEKKGPIAVFDMGGTSMDVSILGVYDGVFKLKAATSDRFLGGRDFDKLVVEFLVSEFKRTESIDLSKDEFALRRLTEAAEKSKIELSTTSQSTINLPYIAGLRHFSFTLTRAQFECLVSNLVEKAKDNCEYWLKDADVVIKDVEELIVVGGMSNVHKVREMVTDVFNKTPLKSVIPEEAVAMGAALVGQCRGDVAVSLFPSIPPEKYGSFFTRFESSLLSSWIILTYPSIEPRIMSMVNVFKAFYYWCDSKVLKIVKTMLGISGVLTTLVYSFYKGAKIWIESRRAPKDSDAPVSQDNVDKKSDAEDGVDKKSDVVISTPEETSKTRSEWLKGGALFIGGVVVGGVLMTCLSKK